MLAVASVKHVAPQNGGDLVLVCDVQACRLWQCLKPFAPKVGKRQSALVLIDQTKTDQIGTSRAGKCFVFELPRAMRRRVPALSVTDSRRRPGSALPGCRGLPTHGVGLEKHLAIELQLRFGG